MLTLASSPPPAVAVTVATAKVESSRTRTYEDLDLSGPEAAVAEFISAFIRRDYIAAALILHPDATDDERGRRERPHRTRRSNAEPAVVARMAIERDGDHLLGGVRVFEMAMEEAMTNGGFIVDLASGAEGLTLRSSDCPALWSSRHPLHQRQRRRLRTRPDLRRAVANPLGPTRQRHTPSDPLQWNTDGRLARTKPRTPQHLAQHAPQ